MGAWAAPTMWAPPLVGPITLAVPKPSNFVKKIQTEFTLNNNLGWVRQWKRVLVGVRQGWWVRWKLLECCLVLQRVLREFYFQQRDLGRKWDQQLHFRSIHLRHRLRQNLQHHLQHHLPDHLQDHRLILHRNQHLLQDHLHGRHIRPL